MSKGDSCPRTGGFRVFVMSSEVETSLAVDLGQSERYLDFARHDKKHEIVGP